MMAGYSSKDQKSNIASKPFEKAKSIPYPQQEDFHKSRKETATRSDETSREMELLSKIGGKKSAAAALNEELQEPLNSTRLELNKTVREKQVLQRQLNELKVSFASTERELQESTKDLIKCSSEKSLLRSQNEMLKEECERLRMENDTLKGLLQKQGTNQYPMKEKERCLELGEDKPLKLTESPKDKVKKSFRNSFRIKQSRKVDTETHRKQELEDKFNDETKRRECKTEGTSVSCEAKGLVICGIAVLDQEVFIVRVKSQSLEVYDSTKFHLKRRLDVVGMTNPDNISSSQANACIYAFDWSYRSKSTAILTISPGDGTLIGTWNVNETVAKLSIASDGNVILTTYDFQLHEYTGDGKLIRDIDLTSGTGIIIPNHVVKLNNGQFVVCHSDAKELPNRVCMIEIKQTESTPGRPDEVNITRTFPEEHGDWSLMEPIYMSVGKKGSILVSIATGKTSGKIVLLSSKLDKPQEIASEKDGLNSSLKTCFNESTGQWLVADNNRVITYRVKGKDVHQVCYNLPSL